MNWLSRKLAQIAAPEPITISWPAEAHKIPTGFFVCIRGEKKTLGFNDSTGTYFEVLSMLRSGGQLHVCPARETLPVVLLRMATMSGIPIVRTPAGSTLVPAFGLLDDDGEAVEWEGSGV